MAPDSSPRLIDLDRVLDLHQEHIGTRPQRATIRSYHSRGQMPRQVTPGQWNEADILMWIATRRSRMPPDRQAAICGRLTVVILGPAGVPTV